MFAYCYNDPVNYIDPYGESGVAAALAGWASSAWGLTLVDGPIPVGDIIYFGGCVILGTIALIETVVVVDKVVDIVAEATDTTPDSTEFKPESQSKGEGEKSAEDTPKVDYPGDDPNVAPEGYTWKGKGPQGSKQGNYYNPNGKQSLHPDLDHPPDIGPHWDYNYKGSGTKGWRVFPNGEVLPK